MGAKGEGLLLGDVRWGGKETSWGDRAEQKVLFARCVWEKKGGGAKGRGGGGGKKSARYLYRQSGGGGGDECMGGRRGLRAGEHYDRARGRRDAPMKAQTRRARWMDAHRFISFLSERRARPRSIRNARSLARPHPLDHATRVGGAKKLGSSSLAGARAASVVLCDARALLSLSSLSLSAAQEEERSSTQALPLLARRPRAARAL